MEVARSMMFHTNVPKRFWGDAVLASCYLINRIPTKVLKDSSPFEVLNNIKPSIDHLRVFGCVCFVLVQGGKRSKLDAKSTKCMFLGYSTTQKGYKCYDPINNRTFVSREVKFLEGQGYYDKRDWESLKDLSSSPSDLATSLRFLLDHLGNQDKPRQEETKEAPSSTSRETSNAQEEEPSAATQQDHIPNQEEESPQDQNQEDLDIGEEDSIHHEGEEAVIEEAVQPLRRSARLLNNPRVYYNNQAVAHPIQAVCSIALLPSDQ